MSAMNATATAREDRLCPYCGRAYSYRIRDHGGVAQSFGVAGEYRCDPRQDPYVYFHDIDREQAVDIAYNPRREVRR